MTSTSPEVFLFSTCLIDSFYPEFGMDSAALLKLCGYQVKVPSQQTCCGQPPYNSGFSKQSIPVAKQVLNTFSHSDIPLIVPSASCAGMIKHHYTKLFPEDSPEHALAQSLSARTFELLDFIVDKLPYQQVRHFQPIQVCLHRSCSAQREMNVSASWELILSRLKGVEVLSPQYAEECCGFGGTFSVKSPDVSLAMTTDKCAHLKQTGADRIVTGDAGCLMNISSHYQKLNEPIPVLHHARFIAKRFGIEYEA